MNYYKYVPYFGGRPIPERASQRLILNRTHTHYIRHGMYVHTLDPRPYVHTRIICERASHPEPGVCSSLYIRTHAIPLGLGFQLLSLEVWYLAVYGR